MLVAPAIILNNNHEHFNICLAHVEIKCKLSEKSSDIHMMIEDHLKECLPGWVTTKLKHSYDEAREIYRFDIRPQGELHLFEIHIFP